MNIDKENKLIRGQILLNASLAPFTTWRVGGIARQIFIPVDLDDLRIFLRQLPHREPVEWLGRGSNVLVRDRGFPGTVIVTKNICSVTSYSEPEITIEHCYPENISVVLPNDAQVIYRVECGYPSAQFAVNSIQAGFSGLEFLAGIPGSVGGALAMNAGAHGGNTWNHVVAVETVNREGDTYLRLPKDFEVHYRQVESPNCEWFYAGYFALREGDQKKSTKLMKEIINARKKTQPLTYPNAGSVFRNPPNDYAARLIQACDLKGFCFGDACISEKHANFIVNRGHATAMDIERLICLIEEMVQTKFDIALKREIKIIG